MHEVITPVNITGAAFITQLSLVVIMFICAGALAWGNVYTSGEHFNATLIMIIIITLTLITFGCLAFSDEFSRIWQPLFGGTTMPLLRWSAALFIMFTLDIIGVTLMVAGSGGSQISGFSPIYFILPALAIFLREPLGRIIFYLILISIVFSINLSKSLRAENIGGRMGRIAYWFVSIACFVLATFIGYITRPR